MSVLVSVHILLMQQQPIIKIEGPFFPESNQPPLPSVATRFWPPHWPYILALCAGRSCLMIFLFTVACFQSSPSIHYWRSRTMQQVAWLSSRSERESGQQGSRLTLHLQAEHIPMMNAVNKVKYIVLFARSCLIMFNIEHDTQQAGTTAAATNPTVLSVLAKVLGDRREWDLSWVWSLVGNVVRRHAQDETVEIFLSDTFSVPHRAAFEKILPRTTRFTDDKLNILCARALTGLIIRSECCSQSVMFTVRCALFCAWCRLGAIVMYDNVDTVGAFHRRYAEFFLLGTRSILRF